MATACNPNSETETTMANTTHSSKNQLRIQNLLFMVLFLSIIGLLAWLSTQHTLQSDWTADNRNTLSEASSKLLESLDQPVEVSIFIRESNPEREIIYSLLQRYQRQKSDFNLTFVNPDIDPQLVREEGITMEGEMVIRYGDKRENIRQLSEQVLTNALYRLARADERWIVFLTGHGERDPMGEANFHFGEWGQQLQQKGFRLHRSNLGSLPEIPANTSVLVIADPQTPLLPGEIAMIQLYLQQGGNLLWLRESEQSANTALLPLEAQLGIKSLSGTLVDPTGQLLGITDPRFALVAEYPQHPVTAQLASLTLFPQAGGLEVNDESEWQSDVLLSTLPRSWLEMDEIIDQVDFNQGHDQPGPIILGLALSKEQQRVVVIHDADFLSNSYLGNGANMDLGLNIINWLSHDDNLIDIPVKSSPDNSLELGSTAQIIIGFGFIVFIPGVLLISGLWIWLRRRKR